MAGGSIGSLGRHLEWLVGGDGDNEVGLWKVEIVVRVDFQGRKLLQLSSCHIGVTCCLFCVSVTWKYDMVDRVICHIPRF